MNTEEKEDETTHRVTVHHDEQLSIGDPLVQENALDWREMGKSAPGEASLAHIKEVWTGMKLSSLKKKAGGR
jgi:uncharacterized protein YbdZ (MbtH family)